METDLLMSPNFDLTCVVPRSGRTLRNFLHRLVGLGANAEEIAQIVRLIDVSTGSSVATPIRSVATPIAGAGRRIHGEGREAAYGELVDHGTLDITRSQTGLV